MESFLPDIQVYIRMNIYPRAYSALYTYVIVLHLSYWYWLYFQKYTINEDG